MGPGLFSDRLRINPNPKPLAFSTNADRGAVILSVSPCHSPTILSTATTNGAANPSAVDTTDCLMSAITLPTRSGKDSKCDRSTWGIRLLMNATVDCQVTCKESVIAPIRSGNSRNASQVAVRGKPATKPTADRHTDWIDSDAPDTNLCTRSNTDPSGTRGKPATSPTVDRQAALIASPALATTDRARSTSDRSGKNSTSPITEATDRHALTSRSPIPPNHAGNSSNRDQLIAGTNSLRDCTMDRQPATS